MHISINISKSFPTARQKENLEEWHCFTFMLPSVTSGSLKDGGTLFVLHLFYSMLDIMLSPCSQEKMIMKRQLVSYYHYFDNTFDLAAP